MRIGTLWRLNKKLLNIVEKTGDNNSLRTVKYKTNGKAQCKFIV